MQRMSAPKTPQLLTKKKLLTAFFVQLSEAYQMTVLFPMVVFMCRDFGIRPNMLGIYSSLLNASFMFCQFLVSYLWGSFSDKYGRRLALVVGLLTSIIGVLVFGFAKSYLHAMLARCLCGLFNGNLSVLKSWLSDITDSANRSFAFSIIAISFGFGNILGSLMGGLLIETHNVDLSDDEYTPTVGILKFWIFGSDFPFLLPCLAGALISGNAVFWTLYQVKNENQARLTKSANIDDSMAMAISYANQKDNDLDSDLIAMMDIDPIPAKSNIDIKSVSIYETNCSSSRSFVILTEINSLPELIRQTDLIQSLLCYVIIAICVMMFHEMNPVYMAQALLFNSQFIGYVQAWAGVSLLIFTFCFQPYFLKHFQHRNMGIFNSIMLAIVIILIPSNYWTTRVHLLNKSWVALIGCFACETLMVVFVSTLFVISTCFINNSVPPQHCGKANGLAQSCASLVRAIGPVITGFIWSESVKYINTAPYAVYWAYLPSFFGFILMALHMFYFIKPQYQFTWEKQLEMKKTNNNFR